MYKLLAEVFCITESKLLFVAVDAITFWKIQAFKYFRKQITAKLTYQFVSILLSDINLFLTEIKIHFKCIVHGVIV